MVRKYIANNNAGKIEYGKQLVVPKDLEDRVVVHLAEGTNPQRKFADSSPLLSPHVALGIHSQTCRCCFRASSTSEFISLIGLGGDTKDVVSGDCLGKAWEETFSGSRTYSTD